MSAEDRKCVSYLPANVCDSGDPDFSWYVHSQTTEHWDISKTNPSFPLQSCYKASRQLKRGIRLYNGVASGGREEGGRLVRAYMTRDLKI